MLLKICLLLPYIMLVHVKYEILKLVHAYKNTRTSHNTQIIWKLSFLVLVWSKASLTFAIKLNLTFQFTSKKVFIRVKTSKLYYFKAMNANVIFNTKDYIFVRFNLNQVFFETINNPPFRLIEQAILS